MPGIDAHAPIVIGICIFEQGFPQLFRVLLGAWKAGRSLMLDDFIRFAKKTGDMVMSAPVRVVREFVVIEPHQRLHQIREGFKLRGVGCDLVCAMADAARITRSEEHTSELQSPMYLV